LMAAGIHSAPVFLSSSMILKVRYQYEG
jgi:hypothetical protein